MMQTSWGQLIIGSFFWTIVMLLPVFIARYQTVNPLISAVLLTVIYPATISLLSRRGNFWVSYNVIMIASAFALISSLIIQYGTKQTGPVINTVIPVSVFIIALMTISTQLNMYNNRVINP